MCTHHRLIREKCGHSVGRTHILICKNKLVARLVS